jgi:ATP/maltotriose-dependent transcriptional regulator MalT
LWGLGGRSSVLRGGALVRLADLRARQGRYEEAAELLADGDLMDAVDAARPRAVIHVANDEPDVARDILDAALSDVPPDSPDGAALLELLVEVLLSLGDVDTATRRLDQLEQAADSGNSAYVRALAALSRGRMCLATGRDDPQACLREALKEFNNAHVPLETALARLELAGMLAADRPTAAVSEARAALETFERLKATRHADEAAALLRSLGVRASGGRQPRDILTRREADVLRLLGRGLSNPEIASRLYISRKTVEHHVSNILAKLHLRSRAEAAAYAIRTLSEPAPE